MSAEGRGIRTLTEGDAVDECPAWAAGAPGVETKRLVYQSSGVSRNPQGFQVGYGPYTIQELETDSGAVKTIAKDQTRDCLSPRLAADGSLYYIRRPYRPLGQPASIWKVLQD